MVFTNTGIGQVIDYLAGNSPDYPTHIAVGTDTTSANEADTALGTEVLRMAIASTTTTSEEITFSILVDGFKLAGNTLTEVGLFDAATSGNCYTRSTHAAIIKTALLEVEYEITLKLTN